MAYRLQDSKSERGPRSPTPLYVDATAVLHETATEQASWEMKYLAAKLAIAQEARPHGKIQTAKIDGCLHLSDIPTKPL